MSDQTMNIDESHAPAPASPGFVPPSANWQLPALGLALAAAAGLLLAMGANQPLFLWINQAQPASDTVLSMFCVGGLGLSAFIAASALSARGPLRLMAGTLWCLLIGGTLVHLVKRLAALPRPAAVLPPDLLHVVGQPLMHGAMPSGHSATAAAFCVLLIYCGRPGNRRLPVAAAAAAFAAVTAISRIAVGAHWPSDVLAGAGLGIVSAWLAMRCEQRWRLADRLEHTWGRRLLALCQLGAGVAMIVLPTGYPLAQPFQWLLGAVGIGAGAVNLYASVTLPATRGHPRPA